MTRVKRIGILGGMGPESTTEFYNLLLKKYYRMFHNYAYPEIVIFSVNFEKMIKLQESGNKKRYAQELMKGIRRLENAGADFAVIASNTPHLVFEQLQRKSSIPLLSMVQSTAQKAKRHKMSKVLLLGTRFTMESSFYKDDFKKLGIQVIVPSKTEQDMINNIIYKELVLGVVKKESKKRVLKIIKDYVVDGVILGCTELPIILTPQDTKVALLNTVEIHVEATLDYALR